MAHSCSRLRNSRSAAVQARPVAGERYRWVDSRAIRQMSYFIVGKADNVERPWAAVGDGAVGDQRRRTISTVDGFLAINTGSYDCFVQFLAGDRLVQDTITAGGGFLDARRRGIAGHDNGRGGTARIWA